VEGEVVAPDGDNQPVVSICPAKIARAYSTTNRFCDDHAFVGNTHGVDEIGLDLLDERAESFCRGAYRQGADPLPDGSPQAEGARRGAARALSPPFESAKRHRDDLESLDREIQCAGKGGGDEDIVAAFDEVTDPVQCDGGACVDDEQNFHDCGLYVIARCSDTGYS